MKRSFLVAALALLTVSFTLTQATLGQDDVQLIPISGGLQPFVFDPAEDAVPRSEDFIPGGFIPEDAISGFPSASLTVDGTTYTVNALESDPDTDLVRVGLTVSEDTTTVYEVVGRVRLQTGLVGVQMDADGVLHFYAASQPTDDPTTRCPPEVCH